MAPAPAPAPVAVVPEAFPPLDARSWLSGASAVGATAPSTPKPAKPQDLVAAALGAILDAPTLAPRDAVVAGLRRHYGATHCEAVAGLRRRTVRRRPPERPLS